MIISVYEYYKYGITLLRIKAKIIFRKNTHKNDISGFNEKYDIHPRKHGISVEIPY